MRITSKKLAELAGVSRGTVDRALNNRGGVRPEVQKRILEIAAQYGYRPMRAGKALVTRETVTIGVLLNSVGNFFFEDVIKGMEEARRDFSDFSVDIKMHQLKGFSLQEQLAALDEMQKENLSALILTPINHPDVAERINAFSAAGCPVVTINLDIDDCQRLAYVGCDYFRSGQTAAHLMGMILGVRTRALVVTGSLRVLGHNQRVYGFSRVLKSDFPNADIIDVVENNDDDDQSYQVVAQALSQFPQINAVYFAAGGVMGGIKAVLGSVGCGRTVLPTVITCDLNDTIADYIKRDIIAATICQQPYLQGYTSVKTILNHLLFQQDPPSDKIYTQNEIKIKYNI